MPKKYILTKNEEGKLIEYVAHSIYELSDKCGLHTACLYRIKNGGIKYKNIEGDRDLSIYTLKVEDGATFKRINTLKKYKLILDDGTEEEYYTMDEIAQKLKLSTPKIHQI